MKRPIKLPSLLLSIILLASCNNANNTSSDVNTSSSDETIQITSGYTRYDVEDKNESPIVGFGAQMDTDIFMPQNNMSAEDEKIWEERIAEMNLKYTRIKYFPEFLERENDNDDPNSFDFNANGVDINCAEMQALYKVLDICQKYDIKVDFSVSGCWHWFKSYDGKYTSSWLASDSPALANYWVTGPYDYYEYAENVAAVLDLLINQKGYTCIWGVSNISESFFDMQGVKHWEDYVLSCQIIHEKLQKEGLRDKVKLFGTSECGNIPKLYDEELSTVDDIFDVCGNGNYMWDYRCYNESMQNYFEEMIAIMKKHNIKDYAISEFCQGLHFLDAVNKTDIDDYEAGLYIARFCIEAAKAGVTAFDHYILGDCLFGSYIHTMGLWMYRDSNLTNEGYISWAAHPEFYFYRMICKYTDTGAYAYKVNQELVGEYADVDRYITAVAFELPDGKWSYMIANNSSDTRKIAIVNQNGNIDKMNCYKVTESMIPEDRNCEPFEAFKEITVTNGVAYLSVPANGLLVVSNK
ncbi:MAG: hypothetical protein MR270_00370 [Erysipelotrichaceae bacterium]|nr:hypothetical protein [Erysipelotrichaceae bacterium]